MPEAIKTSIFIKAKQNWPNDISMQKFIIEKETNGYHKLTGAIESYSKIGIPDKVFSWSLLSAKKKVGK